MCTRIVNMQCGGVMLLPSVDFKLSKVEILRGIVCEKLTTAAQEIFAVLERTVSGYEEEAAALRRDVDRYKNQLEAVLQPRVLLCRTEPAREEENKGGELLKDKTEQTDLEDSASWVGLTYEQEDDVEDQELEKNECGTINLQVCLLQDAQTDMPTRNVFKSSVQEVTCPPGLQEEDFLDLLRSTFPQLSGEFETFTVDLTRKLVRLNLETMVPKDIEAAIKSRGNKGSALYIRVKGVKESQSSTEQPPSSEANDKTKDDATNDEEGSQESSSSIPVDSAESRQQQMEPKEDVEHETVSEDFSPPGSAHSAADSNEGDDVEEVIDDRDEEWTPEENDKEIKSLKPKRRAPKMKKKMRVIVKRKRKNPEVSTANCPLPCRVCQALSGSENMLIKHSWSHVDSPERLCGVCGEHSESPEELRSHLNSHKETYSCEECGKRFMSEAGLQRHAVLHTGERPHKCGVCEKSFACVSTFKAHRWEHEEKPYKCDICNKSFAVKCQERVHRRSHTGEKPYTCDVCGKSVGDLRTFSRHKLSHFTERSYTCQVCEKSFLSPFRLKVHEKIHKERVKSFLCDICCKTFHTPGELRAHLTRHRKEKFICSVCGKGLSSKGALKGHLTVHTGERHYECSVCEKTFKHASNLQSHMKLHSGIKAHMCSVCGKAFSKKWYLTVHMRSHNGERPYKCTLCDQSFTQSQLLRKHKMTHHREEEDGGKD